MLRLPVVIAATVTTATAIAAFVYFNEIDSAIKSIWQRTNNTRVATTGNSLSASIVEQALHDPVSNTRLVTNFNSRRTYELHEREHFYPLIHYDYHNDISNPNNSLHGFYLTQYRT